VHDFSQHSWGIGFDFSDVVSPWHRHYGYKAPPRPDLKEPPDRGDWGLNILPSPPEYFPTRYHEYDAFLEEQGE